MIPLIMIDSATVPGGATILPGEPVLQGDLRLFGDVFALSEIPDRMAGEILLADGRMAAPSLDHGSLAEAEHDSARVGPDIVLPDSVPAPVTATTVLSLAGVGQAANGKPLAGNGAVLAGPAATGDGADPAPDVAMLPATKKATSPATTIAQTLVEGRFPQQLVQALPRVMGRNAATQPVDGPAPSIVGRPAQDVATKSAAALGADIASLADRERPWMLDPGPKLGREKPPAGEGKPAPAAPAAFTPMSQSVPPPAVALAKENVAPFARLIEQENRKIERDLQTGFAVAERGGMSVGSVTSAPATAGPETARHVAGQIALALAQQPGKPIEIALNPEELGRVKLSLSAADGAISLTILAERPETHDLLRRHIDVLAQEFRSLGYTDITFSFGKDGQSGTSAQAGAEKDQTFGKTGEGETLSGTVNDRPLAGLDLRL